MCTAETSGASDSVRCPRLVNGEPAALGKRQSDAAINHRTVRWCIGLSGESSATNSSLSGKEKGDVAIIHRTVRWCTGLSGGAPDCPVSQRRQRPTVVRAINARHMASSNGRLGAPDCPVFTGQCPVRHLDRRSNGRLRPIWKEIVHRTSYRTCPVAHRTVGCATRQKARIALAPSYLGAIKRTPRHMEQNTKLSRNILRLPDSVSTHLIRYGSDLSSV
jgi:hypothetical protein